MGGFSVWHWVVLLVFLVLPVAFFVWTARRTVGPGGPVGFGGWLLLLAIGQCINLLTTARETIALYGDLAGTAVDPAGKIVAVVGIAMMAAVLAFVAWVTVAMFNRSPRFKKLFVSQAAATAIMAGLSITIEADLATLGSDIAAIVGSFVWSWYVLVSVRVRNTFDAKLGPLSATFS